MLHDRHRAHIYLSLLGLILVGWLAAPLVHEVEHAVRLAESAHQHDHSAERGFVDGCDAPVVDLEECSLCWVRFALDYEGATDPTDALRESELCAAAPAVVDVDAASFRPIRAPPVVS